MKKVKYVFLFLIALCFMPNIVSAKQNVYFKPYKIGDKITVTLDEKDEVKGNFIVIENSEEKNVNVSDDYDFSAATQDYQYVTAIYEGTVGKSIYVDSNDKTYKNSLALSNLNIMTRDLGWINHKEIRLLQIKDLEAIGGIDFKFSELLNKYPWLALEEDYWLGEDATTTTTGGTCPINGECSTITLTYATAISQNELNSLIVLSKIGLRPVIKIHKGFVEDGMICNCADCEEERPTINKVCPNDSKISIQSCIDGGQTEETCIKKLCPGSGKIENPKTGSYIPFVVLGLGIIAVFVCISIKNKTYFRKVK